MLPWSTNLSLSSVSVRKSNSKQKNNGELYDWIRKNIFACLFSVHNTLSFSRHEQVFKITQRSILFFIKKYSERHAEITKVLGSSLKVSWFISIASS